MRGKNVRFAAPALGLTAACHVAATAIILAVCALGGAFAAPGTIVEATATGSYSAGEIGRGAQYAVDTYLIRYSSTVPDGTETVITAHLLLPRTEGGSELPVYVFGPGSTGLIDRCAPSSEHIRGINWGRYREHTLMHAGQGLIGVMPDYMGFGVPDMLQPYFVADAAGVVMLDAIRAAHNFAREQDAEVVPGGAFVAGFSQGGHAAFAAADMLADYAPEVPLLGVIGYGPTTDVANVLREFTVVAPMIVYTYAQLYGYDRVDPDAILDARWARSLESDVTEMCIGAMQQHYPWSPEPMFTSEFTEALVNNSLDEAYPEMHELIIKNSSGLAGHGIPALILQGTEDIVINVNTQTSFVRDLCETGAPVRYPHYVGVRHDTRDAAFYDAQDWMRHLAKGETAPDDCGLFAAGDR